jgi:hypothetical protein
MSVTAQLVEDALKLSAKHLGDGKTYDGVVDEVRRSDELQGKRLAILNRELKETREAMVEHLYQARFLERKIINTRATESDIKSHIKHQAMTADNAKMAMDTDTNDPLSRRTLDMGSLMLVESVVGHMRMGTASMVQTFLEEYSDAGLTVELSRVPPSLKKNMTTDVFSDLVVHASSQYLSGMEGNQLYALSKGGKKGRWERLCRRFQKKLFRVHLSRELVLKAKMFDSVVQPEGLLLPPSRRTSRMERSSGPESMSMQSPSRKSSTTSTSLSMDGGNANAVTKLQKQLKRATAKQQGHKDSIISNLSSLSKSVPLSADTHSSAWNFSKRMGARKVETILRNKVTNMLVLAMDRWCKLVELVKMEDACATVCQNIATVRMTRYLDEIFASKLKRGFRKLAGKVQSNKDMEFHSAIVEMQRVARGLLGRRRAINLIRTNAITHVQRLGRGKLSKMRVVNIKRERDLRAAVKTVEKAWKAQIWMRTLKKLRQVAMRHRAATRIAAGYRGFCGRVGLRKKWKKFYRRKGAIKMQALVRRYQACVYFDWYKKNKRLIDAVTVIQCAGRCMNSRNYVQEVREQNLYAGKISRFLLVRLAIYKVTHWRRYVNARKIQRLRRGNKARKRCFKLKNAKSMAGSIVQKVVYSFRTRQIWGPVLKDHLFKRANAANVIKIQLMKAVIMGRKARRRWHEILEAMKPIYKLARRFLKVLHDESARIAQFAWASTTIQRHWRGIWGRERAVARRIVWEHEEALRKRPPAYYRIKEDYFKEQNLFHKPYVIKIQCSQRCMVAWRRVDFMRRTKQAKIIQARARKWLEIKEAMRELRRRKEWWRKRNAGALYIQRVARGRQGRYEARKHHHAEICKWFINEVKSQGMVGKALQLFRVRKKNLEKAHANATIIQALGRSYLGRGWLRNNFKRLVREKKKRAELKRHRMATEIQCLIRVAQAKVRFAAKVIEHELIKAERAELEKLEENLGAMHEDHLQNLLATRVQTGGRSMFAKSSYAQKKEAAKEAAIKKEFDRTFKAAQTMQALIRGMVHRMRFEKNLSQLKRDKQVRMFCVECESKLAERRCRVCRDRYCAACYEKMHKKGNRKKHGWDAIVDDKKKKPPGGDGGSKSGTAGGSKSGTAGGPAKPAAQWEEYNDDQMNAKYWYNVDTGEATWIPPPGFS